MKRYKTDSKYRELDMNKLMERVATMVLVAVVAVCFLGMYVTWRNCTASGGTTVRGLFGLECVAAK